MAKRSNSKAAKIRALLAERPGASAKEIIETLAAKRVRVTPAQVYNLKSIAGKPSRKKSGAYNSLIQAKRMADALGGVDKARAALAVLVRLV
jgi:arginine repressor